MYKKITFNWIIKNKIRHTSDVNKCLSSRQISHMLHFPSIKPLIIQHEYL